jgi:hypothetical protein
VHTLADGSRLLLTTTVMRDRNGRGDGLEDRADQRTTVMPPPLAAAQPGCWPSPPARAADP